MNRIFRVGLTGGIASGKSTVVRLFANHGVPVIDADSAARAVVQRGTPALAALEVIFGAGILDDSGSLDRASMRKRIFGDAAARAKLEAVLHPAIRAEMDARAREAGGVYQIFEIPLLVETHGQSRVDRVLVVDCPRDVQLKRLRARDGTTLEQAEAMLASQASREERLAAADDVLPNGGELSSLRDKVDLLHRKYVDLAEQRLRDPTP